MSTRTSKPSRSPGATQSIPGSISIDNANSVDGPNVTAYSVYWGFLGAWFYADIAAVLMGGACYLNISNLQMGTADGTVYGPFASGPIPFGSWPTGGTIDTTVGIEFSNTLEEYVDAINDDPGDDTGIIDDINFGGIWPKLNYDIGENAVGPEGYPYNHLQFFELITAQSLTFTCAGYSKTVTLSTGIVATKDMYAVFAQLVTTSTANGSLAASYNWSDPSGTLPHTYAGAGSTYSDGNPLLTSYHAALTSTGLSIDWARISVGGFVTFDINEGPGAYWQTWADFNLALDGRLRSMELPYGGSKGIVWSIGGVDQSLAAAATYSNTSNRRGYVGIIVKEFNGSFSTQFSEGANDIPEHPTPVFVRMDDGGEDPSDWRIGLFSDPYDAMTIVQASPLNLAGSWSTSSGTITGPTTWIFSGTWKMEGYRYLKVTMTGPDGPAAIRINGKLYKFTLDGSGSYLIDLMIPANKAGVDDQDSRYPYLTLAGEDPKNEGIAWGINAATSITLELSTPGTYSVTSVDLVIANVTKANFMQPFKNYAEWGPIADDSSAIILPSFWLDCDEGKRLDSWHGLVNTSGADTGPYYWPTIADFGAWLNTIPGFTATVAAAADWENDPGDLPAISLGKDGAAYSDGAFIEHMDYAPTAGTWTVKGQRIIDIVEVYPGFGNLASHAYGANVIFPFQKNLLGGPDGLAGAGGVPEAGDTISTMPSALTTPSFGSGSTDANGYYRTGQPFGIGSKKTKLTRTLIPHSAEAVFTWYPHWRGRASFLFRSANGSNHGYDVSGAFYHGRTSLTDAGNLAVGYADNKNQAWTDSDTGQAATWGRCRWLPYQGAKLGVFYGDGTDTWYGKHVQESNTLAEIVSLGEGVMGDFEVTPFSQIWFFKTVSSGADFDVWFRSVDNLGTVLTDWTVTNVVGIDTEAIAVRSSYLSGGFRIGLYYEDGGTKFVKFSPDGLSFA